MKIILLALFPLLLFSQENFRIFPSDVTQTEPSAVISSTDTNMIFVSGVSINTSNGFKSEGVYVSTDGGSSWFGSDTCKGQILSNHGGDPGVIIDKNNRFIITHIGNPSLYPGLYSHYSTNLGSTWSNAYAISSVQTEDKGSSTSDNYPASPYYGLLYASWVNIATSFPVLFSLSKDGGISWSAPKTINPNPPARCSGGYIKSDKNGKIYVVWSGMTSSSPFYENYAGLASSTDTGFTWTVYQNIFDMNGIAGTLTQKSGIRVNGLPQVEIDRSNGPRSGWIYIVTNEKGLAPSGNDPDIILHRSSDGGATWSTDIRVNQDALNNGKIQYFPAMDIDEGGGINIIYYDDRYTTSDSAEVMLSRSTDGGSTWTDIVISDHRFKPKPIYGSSSNYQGDHIVLFYSHKKLYAFWMDNYTGIYQIWGKIIPVEISALSADESQSVVNSFELKQNYPNPFNPSTDIAFTLQERSNVSIEIFNSLGQRITELFRGELYKGEHSINWNATGLSTGFYFCKVTRVNPENNNTQTKTIKMVLMK